MSKDLVVYGVQSNAVVLNAEAIRLKDEALARSALIGLVNDAESNKEATGAMIDLKRVIAATEKTRKEVKEPILELGRKVDEAAKKFSAELIEEFNRLSRCSADFQTAELERVKAQERARQMEAERIERERLEAQREIERQRLAAEREAREKEEAIRRAVEAEARAKAEAARRIAEAEARAKAEAEMAAARSARAKAEAEARAKAEQQRIAREAEEKAKAEAARIAQEAEARAKAEQERIAKEAEARAAAENARRAVELDMATPPPQVKAAGQSVKPTWCWEITDLWTLARMHPGLVEITPRKREINEVVEMQANSGATPQVAGLRIWSEVKVSVRTNTKTIDV